MDDPERRWLPRLRRVLIHYDDPPRKRRLIVVDVRRNTKIENRRVATGNYLSATSVSSVPAR